VIKYDPKDAVIVLPAGEYPAELSEVHESTSKAGNPMHELKFSIFTDRGRVIITDYISYPSATWKLKKLARAFDALPAFDAQAFDPAVHKGNSLMLTIGIKEWEGQEQNKVDGYAQAKSEAVSASAKVNNTDDDLPF